MGRADVPAGGCRNPQYLVLSTECCASQSPLIADMTSHERTDFADRLIAAVLAKRNPVLVGLDPRAENLPAGLIVGEGLEATASGFASFCRGVIDVVAPLVPAVKPQAAFFEQLGPAGMRSLKEVIDYASANGLIV